MIDQFLEQLAAFGAAESSIDAIVLVGSHANGDAKPDSDVDVVIITKTTEQLMDGFAWAYRFGRVTSSEEEDHGLVQSLRVFYDGGLEVEFGITSSDWIADDQLKETGSILKKGYRVIYDPQNVIEPFYARCGAIAE